ncbi:MAG: putative toxin-antitoxin system toxin component, PIN family [Elusimicrobiota bacterium]
MRRIVFDTNILVSAFLFGGKPALAVNQALKGDILAFTSPILLAELSRILIEKFRLTPLSADAFTAEWKDSVQVIEPTTRISMVKNDPSDDRVLECALTSHADAIVSGDRHLLTLKVFRSIPILNPAAYLAHWPR